MDRAPPKIKYRRDFDGKEDRLIVARKKAHEIASKSVIQVFESSQFEEKAPFPSLEEFYVECSLLGLPKEDDMQIDREIYDFFKGLNVGISSAFLLKFLEKTSTVRKLQINRT